MTDTTSFAQRPHRSRRREWGGVVVGAALVIGVRLFLLEPFVIPSESMEPGLAPGDRVLVWKPHGPTQRSEVVVFDGARIFGHQPLPEASGWEGVVAGVSQRVSGILGGRDSDAIYVKRAVGVGGDTVTCCTNGKVAVNDRPITEPYLFAGDAPSATPFAAKVPPGRLWMMGDHRSHSGDSRSHTAGPGGGTVAEEDVVGTVVFRFWPLDRFGPVESGAAQAGARANG